MTGVRPSEAREVRDLCAASIRALSARPGVHYRGDALYLDHRRAPSYAPHLNVTLAGYDRWARRGVADGLALRLVRSDPALHRHLRPTPAIEYLIFELLEQYRVESLAPAVLPGTAGNLRRLHEHWSSAFQQSGLTGTGWGIMVYATAQMARARLTGRPVVEASEALIENVRATLAPLLGHDLAGLRRHRLDQARYASHARSIARTVRGLIDAIGTPQATGPDGAESGSPFTLYLDAADEPADAGGAAAATSSRPAERHPRPPAYPVFTTAYDRDCPVAALIRPEFLRQLRGQLDARVKADPTARNALVRRLRAGLHAPEPGRWDGGQEDGQLDGGRLAHLLIAPTETRVFRNEIATPAAEAAVTFLIDCSGSMKAHSEDLAAAVDGCVRALELADIPTEVLGFTTGAWNGGRAARDWHRAGRPADPGRLNERLHLVFKDVSTPWRRARLALAGLLKTDLYREGIDGEGVIWACARLADRGERRRILLVLSDGSLMDRATARANPGRDHLGDHLRDVVRWQESVRGVEIIGLGLGVDVSTYYRRNQVLDLSSGGRAALAGQIVATLVRPHPRR